METKNITSHAQLCLQIMHLKAEKFKQEEELKHTFQEFVYTINPVNLVKNSLHDLAEDHEVQFDLAKVGLNMGANFLINQVLGRNRSIKGFLSSMLVEKFSSSYINNNVSKIISGIGNFFKPKAEHETNQH
jgi:hypothetical protein